MDEPLLNEEGMLEFPGLFDVSDGQRLLQELRSLDAAEAGLAGDAAFAEHVDDADVYKMKELIKEKPRDVLQYLDEEGVVKLGEFEIQDAIAFRAFSKEPLLTEGTDHYEVDWEAMWRQQLAEFSSGDAHAGIGWTSKAVMEAQVVNLRDAAAQGSKGLLHPLLKRYQAHACSAAVFGLPAVQAVIHYKWSRWARRFLLYELGFYLAWLAAFTAFSLCFQQEDSSMSMRKLLADRNGFAATVFSLLSLVGMAPFLYMDLCTVAAYGWGWLNAWNLLDMASYVLQVVIAVLHLRRDFVDEGWFSVLVASQQVLMWTKLHYFAKVFNPTKNTLIDTIRVVLDDLKYFLLFLLLTMMGFCMAFYSLFRQDRQGMDFQNLWHSFASMFSYMLAMFDYNVFYNSTNPTAAMVLFIIFEFVMNVLLLNVLIASMTNAFSKVTQDEGLRFLYSKAEIIDELESTLPNWVKSPSWSPAFIHILKLHPDSTYEVSLSSVCAGMGLMENNLLSAQQETKLRVEELEDRMSKLHKKLDVLIKLFISGMGSSHSLGLLPRQATGAPFFYPAGGGGAAAAGRLCPPSGAVGSGAAGASGQQRQSSPFAGGGWTPGAAAGAGAAGAAGGGSSTYLGHSQSMVQPHSSTPAMQRAISQLPERLAAVSGPFLAPQLGFGPLAGFGGGFAPLSTHPEGSGGSGSSGRGGWGRRSMPLACETTPDSSSLFAGAPVLLQPLAAEGRRGSGGRASGSSGRQSADGAAAAAGAAEGGSAAGGSSQSPGRSRSGPRRSQTAGRHQAAAFQWPAPPVLVPAGWLQQHHPSAAYAMLAQQHSQDAAAAAAAAAAASGAFGRQQPGQLQRSLVTAPGVPRSHSL